MQRRSELVLLDDRGERTFASPLDGTPINSRVADLTSGSEVVAIAGNLEADVGGDALYALDFGTGSFERLTARESRGLITEVAASDDGRYVAYVH